MPPRRSARIKANDGGNSQMISPQSFDSDQESPEPDQEAQDQEYSQKKRQKRTVAEISGSPAVSNVKGRRGKLRMLPEMPLDILYEIFGHLTPYDLLRLARTTKALRRILMRRSTISIWKQAFLNESSLPPCPPDLNEPQFTNLLFGHHCHFCSRSNIHDVLWAHRVRCCGECLSNRFVYASSYDVMYPVSSVKRKGRYFSYCLDAVRNEVEQEVSRTSDFARFLSERKQLVTPIQEHARQCQLWQEDLKHNRTLELKDNRTKRRDAILTKLAALGWHDELELLKASHEYNRLCDHRLIKQSKCLTERTWNNIKNELVELLQTIKIKRLRTEYIAVVEKRMKMLDEIVRQFYSTRAVTEVLPAPVDFSNMKPYRTGIMDASDETPLTLCTSEEHFSQLLDLSAVWLHNCNQFLLTLVPSNPALETAARDRLAPLHLATTFFHCRHCNDSISYPRVLDHQCYVPFTETPEEDVFIVSCRSFGREPWNYGDNQFQFPCRASNAAIAILTACEVDPDTVTASEMDILDHRIECLDQSNKKAGRLVMSWRAAIAHEVLYHPEETSTFRWKLVDERTVLEANVIENKRGKSTVVIPMCGFCRVKLYNTFEVTTHMRSVHNKTTIEVDSTFPCRDVPLASFPAVRIPV